MAVIGFTGTREGMTSAQITTVLRILRDRQTDDSESSGLHGDCVGCDAVFDALCRGLNMATACYPGNMTKWRAYTQAEALEEPLHPMKRNPLIVAGADIIIGCPGEFKPRARSGTWATIGMAKKSGKPLCIVFPDGTVETTD